VKRAEIIAVGRLRDASLAALCADYYRRCQRKLALSEREVRDTPALERAIPSEGLLIALDERGRQVDSRELARLLDGWLTAASRLTFIIGGADGLPNSLRARAGFVLALSRLTLGHRIARVVLAEQLYRAVSILEGAPYHRD
jgi:23S rRNA (pseudouridine1915-N3)-methyltransferase